MNRFETTQAMVDAAWDLLFQATVKSNHPFRTPVLGTVARGESRLRTVILRRADAQGRQLTCFTDVRSAKVGELKDTPAVSWHFYHPRKKFQVRARGVMRVHHRVELASEHWEGIGAHGRKDYAALVAPGSASSEATRGLPDALGEEPSADDLAYAFGNFAVLRSRIRTLDLLLLHRQGHQRALAEWTDEGWSSHWVVA